MDSSEKFNMANMPKTTKTTSQNPSKILKKEAMSKQLECIFRYYTVLRHVLMIHHANLKFSMLGFHTLPGPLQGGPAGVEPKKYHTNE